MRGKLDSRLQKIENRLIKMSSLVEKAIGYAFDSLKGNDDTLAIKVMEVDKSIDQLEMEIEGECIRLIALQQPLAGDLRLVAAIMRIITDLERVGDLAENIAKIQLTMETPPQMDFTTLEEMEEVVKDMIYSCIQAFTQRDADLARMVARKDEEVDALYELAYSQLLDLIFKEKRERDTYISMMFVGRFLERMADHLTNICERIIYMIEGVREYY